MPPTPTRSDQGSICAYETPAGTRYRFTLRDAAGRQTTRRGFVTRSEARKERERLMGKVHAGELRVSRETLEGYWERYVAARKPYLEEGSWQDYRNHGARRILPQLGHRKLTAPNARAARLARRAARHGAVGAQDAQQRAEGARRLPQLRGAGRADPVQTRRCTSRRCRPATSSATTCGFTSIGPYLDACHPVYRPLAETLIGTGMRISEALALTLADLDLLRGAIIVARSLKAGGRVGSTKGDRFRVARLAPARAARRRPAAHAAALAAPHRCGGVAVDRPAADVRAAPARPRADHHH